tara:strand:- start:32110 stop:32244 length:135 start_codon:yes stop_codon:yes gene_type:complete
MMNETDWIDEILNDTFDQDCSPESVTYDDNDLPSFDHTYQGDLT